MPVSADYRASRCFQELNGPFYDVVEAARFPKLVLWFRNQRWAARVGLSELSDAERKNAFACFEPLTDNLQEPLALRYHSHQFRTYNPTIGDSRGFLYARLIDDQGQLLDLATKGSGQTSWS